MWANVASRPGVSYADRGGGSERSGPSSGSPPGRLYFLRAEEKHEYRPEQGEEPPASRCYRCCDPGAPLYQAIPVPQINITILKGQAKHKGPSPGGGGAALS